MSKKIGILGGSFDPPHRGHLEITKSSLKKLKLDFVIWAVTKKNPFKKKPFLSLGKRIFLAKKIVKMNKKIKVKSFDKNIRSSNTINLVKYLKKKRSNAEYFFLIGSDNLINFHKWKNWKKLIKICRITVFPRKGYINKSLKSKAVKNVGYDDFLFLKSKMINISSSNIRKNYLKYKN